jgi:hypothetical protein
MSISHFDTVDGTLFGTPFGTVGTHADGALLGTPFGAVSTRADGTLLGTPFGAVSTRADGTLLGTVSTRADGTLVLGVPGRRRAGTLHVALARPDSDIQLAYAGTVDRRLSGGLRPTSGSGTNNLYEKCQLAFEAISKLSAVVSLER